MLAARVDPSPQRRPKNKKRYPEGWRCASFLGYWLREQDLNLRPSDYEPAESLLKTQVELAGKKMVLKVLRRQIVTRKCPPNRPKTSMQKF